MTTSSMDTIPHSAQNEFYELDEDWEIDPENLKKLTERYKGQEFPLFMEELPSINYDLRTRRIILYYIVLVMIDTWVFNCFG